VADLVVVVDVIVIVEKDIVDGTIEDTAAKERHIVHFIVLYINSNRLIHYETVLSMQ